ncbi:hypothetical protein ABH941_000003 [Streptacidiphilus sp. EB103A]
MRKTWWRRPSFLSNRESWAPGWGDPAACRAAGQVEHPGQFGDVRAGALGSVLFRGRVPEVCGQGADRLADRCGDGVSDGVGGIDAVVAQGAYVGQEGFGAARAVGADEDLGAVAVGVGGLGQGVVQDGDVVGGGVGAGVARSKEAGQGFAGVVQEARQWVVAEAVLVGGGDLFFLGVAGDQGGVEVQDQARQVVAGGAGRGYWGSGLGGLHPGGLAGGGPCCPQCGKRRGVGGGQYAPGGGLEATVPNTAAWSRSRARSRMASPPSASITARSTATRPGSCPVPRGRRRRSALLNAPVRPVASARSASRREPAWLTAPRPSDETTSLGRDPVVCTQKDPSCWYDADLRQASSCAQRPEVARVGG